MNLKLSLCALQITVPNASIGSKEPVLAANPRFLAILCYRIVVLLLSSYDTQQYNCNPFHLVSTTSQQALQHHSPPPDTLSGTTLAAVLSI